MYIVEEEKEHVADLRQTLDSVVDCWYWYTVLVLNYLDVCVR
jgi:hypothetical protein